MSFFRKIVSRPQGHYIADAEKIFSVLGSNVDLEKELDLKIKAKELAEILPRLPKKYREILVLRFYEEKSYQEISDILRIPSGSVATLIHRARKLLQKQTKHLVE